MSVGQKHATMMIMGDICIWGCSFCNVITGNQNLDKMEPYNVANSINN